MKKIIIFYFIILYIISAASILAQEPVGWRAFYITIDLAQPSSEAHIIVDNTFAVLWNKFSHFQFTEPWVIVVQDNVQRQSTAYYYMNTLYISIFGLNTSSSRLTIYIVEKAFLTSNALQLASTYWGTDPPSFPSPNSFTLVGFGEAFYTQLQAVYSSPPHGIIFVKEYGEGVEVLKPLPLYTSNGREYVANAYTTPNETMPLFVNVTIYYSPTPIGGESPLSGPGGEPASGGSLFDYIIDLTLSPPYFTDFSNTTLCIIDDVGRYLYYYTYSESVSQRFKKIYVRIPADDYPVAYLKIYRCGEDWDEQSQMTGIYLLPGEYAVSMSLAYPRSIYVYNFRYYDPYGSGGGLIPANITVWFTDGSNQTVAFTGHGWYNFTKDIVRYKLTLQRQAPLSASLYLEPGDILAPHLYDWFFDGVNDYLVIGLQPDGSGNPFIIYGWSEITITESIYLIHPQVRPAWSKTSMYGKHGNPSTFYGPNNLINYTTLDVYFNTWNGTTLVYYALNIFQYRNNWIHTARRFTINREYSFWLNGLKAYSRNIPSTELTILEFNPNSSTCPNCYRRFTLGTNTEFNELMIHYQSYLIIHSRALADSEIQTIYNAKVVNASALEIFIDPTFTDSINYFNLGRHNATVRAYNGVARVLANETWIWHVKSVADDGLLHIKFVPRGWLVEFRAPSDGRLLLAIDTSAYPANQAGLVEDIVVQLGAPGNYVVTLRPSYPWGSPTPTSTPILTTTTTTTTTATETPTETTTTTTTTTTTPGFSCEYCSQCWNAQNPPDWCEYCYLYCEPPSPTYTYTYTSQPGSGGQTTTTSPVQPPPTASAAPSMLIGLGLILGLAGFAFAVVGPAALGMTPSVIYVLMIAGLVPAFAAAVLIAGFVMLALYMFLKERGGQA